MFRFSNLITSRSLVHILFLVIFHNNACFAFLNGLVPRSSFYTSYLTAKTNSLFPTKESHFPGQLCGAAKKSRRHSDFVLNALVVGGGEFFPGDVVKFSDNFGKKSVAVIESVNDAGDAVLIRLVKREGLGNECYLDESEPKVITKASSCILIDAYPSQRVAWSSASPHFNPHGVFDSRD